MNNKLYKLKSNRDTILEDFGDGFVRTFWSNRFAYGDKNGMLYRFDAENMIELTEQERQEVLKKKNLI
jgi:hypothetical protein